MIFTLLTQKQFKLLSDAVDEDVNGTLQAKPGLSDEVRSQLLEIDEVNFISYREHLIENYNELTESEE